MNILKASTCLNVAQIAGVSFVMALSFPSASQAQVEQATQIADPSLAGDRLFQETELPGLQKAADVKNTVIQKAPKGAENVKFTLDSLQIDGVSAYTPADLDPIYRAKLGTVVSLADIYAISSELTRKYRRDGYILTQVVVPPQTIENGIVKLSVVEGFVDQIHIQGEERESAQKQILKYADNLRTDGILNAKALERYLLLINDLPGVTARSILSPSQTKPGASDLTIIIERDVYESEVAFGNYGSRYLGPYQLTYAGSLNSALGFNERISAQFALAGDKERPNELMYGSALYEQILSRFGSKLTVQGSITGTEPGFDLQQFDVEGRSHFLSIGVSHPFIRSRTVNFTGRASFDLRNTYSENNLEPDDRKDRIRSFRLGTTVQYMDTIFGAAGINAFDLEVSHGVGFFGASQQGDANLTRTDGNPQYTKAEIQIQRLQRLTPKLNLLVAGQGQLASTALLSSEEFGVGGLNFGRGYDSSEIVGEDGIAGKVELQWNEPYEISYINGYQLFGFWDVGRVWNKDATTPAAKRDSIASTGFGVRTEITDRINADLAVAFPLTRKVDTTDDRGPRYYFRVSHDF